MCSSDLGIYVFGPGSGFYIGAGLGPGPRDGLMTGLHRRTGWPIGLVRTLIEASVLVAGWAMGGNAGWGPLVFALSIGPMCAVTMRWFVASQHAWRGGADPGPAPHG